MTEHEFLKTYNIADYERPSIAADIAVFSIMDEKNDDLRRLAERKLKILLVKRGSHPCRNQWALPGGFCRPNENVYEAAKRELLEETSVSNAYLQLSDIYGDIGRDPRGWIISSTFLALINGADYKIHAGADAWEAQWFDITFDVQKQVMDENTTQNRINLCLKHDITVLNASIKEVRTFEHCHEHVSYEVEHTEGFAFDHAKIIACSILDLRKKAIQDERIVFDLMPETFTLTELQQSFEIVLNKELLAANFRRKIEKYVVETNETDSGKGFRPAKRFSRNIESFQ